jgi:drug/metabolite transporter (DMT)-like permease
MAWIRIAILSIIWGSSFILMKRGIFDSDGAQLFNGLEVAAIRIASAFLVLLPIILRHIRSIPKAKLWLILLSGFVGNGLPALFFAIAQTKIDSSLSGVLNGLTPIFTAIIGILWFGNKVNKKVLIGISLGLIGSAILVLSAKGLNTEGMAYSILVVLCTLMYGINVNLIKSKLNGIAPLKIASVSFLATGVIALASLIFSPNLTKVMYMPSYLNGLGYLITLGVVGTAFAVIMFNKLIKDTTAVFASSVTYFIPLIAIMWGVLDGESFGLLQIVGAIVIISGVKLIKS